VSSPREVAAARAAFDQAMAALRSGDAAGAERGLRKALRAVPDFVEAQYNLAYVMQSAGRLEEAIAGYRRAIALHPRMAAAHNNLANALRTQGRADEALAHYAEALRIDPRLADALANCGTLLRELGRVEEAIALLERAVALRPDAWPATVNLGIAYHERSRDADAVRCFRRALELEPRSHEALNGLGDALAAQDDVDGAIAAYRQAMALAPGHADAYSNLGTVHQERGEVDAAMASYRAALERRADHADALSNLGYLLQEQGRLDEAIGWYERARAANPRAARAGYNLALALLVRGDFARGWPLHELRFETRPPVATARNLPQPPLAAADLASPQRIAVWREQGVGDQVVYSTLLPELAARGHAIVLEVDRRLVAAYARAHPEWTVVAPGDSAAAFARCTRQVAVGSLPRLLRGDRASFDAQPASLLAADPARVAAYRARLAEPGRRAVAISWRSFQPRGRGYLQRKKSAGLAAFAPLAARGDLRLVDVQYGDTAAERAQFAATGGQLARIDELDLYDDLEGVLAAIEACDLAITTSNVTAHLAGALGKLTLLFYPAGVAPLHYWAPHADGRSRWYPSVRVVTGPQLESWDAAIAAVAALVPVG
jgi:tetratricopeptide (TPR) repeat protein